MANNLLDKSSIILTPTAYNNGEALCVKPSDGSGDFDFSRNSAATRVNAQGLVENVQILSSNLVQNGDFSEEGVQEVSNGSFSQEGSELITNGDFSNGSTGWSKSTQVTIENGVANIISNDGSFQVLVQNNITTIGKSYVLTYTIVSNNDGGLKLGNLGEINSAIGTHSFYFVATETPINIARNSGITDISIDNISVREVGQDWTLGTGWSIGEDKAVADGSSGNLNLTQDCLELGKTYTITYTILDYLQGSLRIKMGGWTSGSLRTSNGTYTEILSNSNPSANTSIYFQGINNFNGSITNISVKEVGMDWTLGTGWSIAEDKAIQDNSTPNTGDLTQSSVFTVGKIYSITFDLEVTSGTISALLGGHNLFNTSGTKTFTKTADSTSLTFRNYNNFIGSISNISVIEITDDTNLPRINYEGFSYQDALGSEEIVNGSFDNGSANWNVVGVSPTFINSTAVFQNDAKIYQANAAAAGKKNKVVINLNEISGDGIRVYYGGGFTKVYSVQDIIDNDLKIEETIEFVGGETLYIYSLTSSTYAIIDNVSVKEYLGQEVVPNSGCGSWLFESQSTNLITYSSDYTQWNKSGSMVITSNNAISPDGTQNASLLTANAANQFIYLSSFSSANSTISLYIKRKTGTGSIELSNNGGASYTALSVTDEWSRVQVTFATSTNQTVIKINTSGDEIYLWGVQVEALSYASSLIPTDGSTVTRNQDVCNNGGSLATINSTEGVLYAEYEIGGDATDPYEIISLRTTDYNDDNVVGIGKNNNNNNIFIRLTMGGTTLFSNLAPTPIDGYNKVAISYKSGNSSAWVNGTKVYSSNSAFTPSSTISKVNFDWRPNQFNFFGKTKAVAVWKEALSDAELTELTTI